VDFANLFVDNDAGELLYYLIAVSLSLAALLIALEQSTRSPREVEAKRYLWATAGVVLAWGVLTGGNLYNLLMATDRDTIVAPLERATIAVVILLIGWAFLAAESPDQERGSRVGLFLLLLLTLAGTVFSIITWREEPATAQFNRHNLGIAWTCIPVVFILLGIGLLFLRYQFAADIPLKLLFMLIILVGHLYTLYQMSQDELDGDAAGWVRVAMLAALPILPIIVYRLVIERFRETVGEVSGWVPTVPSAEIGDETPLPVRMGEAAAAPIAAPVPPPPNAGAQREAINVLRVLGVMLEKPSPTEIPRQIVKAIAATFHADVVGLVSTENPNWADSIAAYNAIKETEVPGLVLDLNEQPTMAHAIELNIQSVLLPTRSSAEVIDLFRRFDVTETGPSGPAYFQPLSRDRKVVGMLILAFPYSSRLLTDEERKLLEALGPVAARLLLVSREAIRSRADTVTDVIYELATPIRDEETEEAIRAEMQGKLEDAQQQVVTLNAQIAQLQQQLEHERNKLTALVQSSSDMSITQQIQVLSTERQRLSQERQELVSALQSAQGILASATADTDQPVYQQMIDALNQEKQALAAEKQRLERELSQLQGAPPDSERLADIINTLLAERDRLAEDHARLKDAIGDAQQQLQELGIEEGFLGFGQLIAHLTEERNRFLKEAKRAMAERDKLLRERQEVETYLHEQQAVTQQLGSLKLELTRLASDREAIIRQRDALKAERDTLNMQREEWLETRVRLTEQYEQLRQENERIKASMAELEDKFRNVHDQLSDTQQIMVGTVQRDQVIRQLEARIDQVEENRSDLEFELIRARHDLGILEQEVQRLEALAQQAVERSPDDREAAEMIVGLTQELRTPLTSIKGYADLLLGESMGILGETQKQFLLRIQVNTEQLMQHVENLIRVLAIDYGGLLLVPRRVDVEDLIDDSITASSSQYREKGLTLHLEIEPELPPIMADRDAMQQILTRLLTNAYLASPPDSAVKIAARHIANFSMIEEQGEQNVIYFAITDLGGGIPQEDVERVFSRHYRAENPLIQGLGDKGAGLSIVKALVLAHGGKIWVETQPGLSTTFAVAIPVDHAFGEKDRLRGSVSRLIEVFDGGNA
jgi:signal transduction histidine kinase